MVSLVIMYGEKGRGGEGGGAYVTELEIMGVVKHRLTHLVFLPQFIVTLSSRITWRGGKRRRIGELSCFIFYSIGGSSGAEITE